MREIQVCEHCGTPLIWTFRWAYKEYFCMNCGALGDMFMGKEVKITPELKLKSRVVHKIWNSLYKTGFLLSVALYKIDGCKKCDAGQNHGDHLTKREIRNGKIAQRILDKMIGIFN